VSPVEQQLLGALLALSIFLLGWNCTLYSQLIGLRRRLRSFEDDLTIERERLSELRGYTYRLGGQTSMMAEAAGLEFVPAVDSRYRRKGGA
jgi:hypothetical protein